MLQDLGVALAPASADLPPRTLEKTVHVAVDAGFDSVWSLDNPLTDQAEPLTLLGFIAARHPDLKIGTAAIVGPVREPILLAKQVATLDQLTGGNRVTLGLTIGRRPRDYELTDQRFNVRGRALDDIVHVVRQCWSGQPLNVNGTRRWSSTQPVGVRPLTSGGPPILLGGQAEPALARAARLGDGYLAPATGGPVTARRNAARLQELGADKSSSSFRLVANVFVAIAATRVEAVEQAAAVFTARHGGPPPWDPDEVIIGGEPARVAEDLAELVDAGFVGLNLVPVVAGTDQIRVLASVAYALRTGRPAAPAPC